MSENLTIVYDFYADSEGEGSTEESNGSWADVVCLIKNGIDKSEYDGKPHGQRNLTVSQNGTELMHATFCCGRVEYMSVSHSIRSK